MLKEVKKLHGWTIHATDGEIGRIDELLFDDASWTVRYVIVNTGSWLLGRKVLITPSAFGALDPANERLDVKLTRVQVENSPDVATDQPVSRHWEINYYDYYAMPYYWGGVGTPSVLPLTMGTMIDPMPLASEPTRSHGDDTEHDRASARLRSTKEISGYGVSATDGHLGHVEDFLVDDRTWQIAYLAVDTKDWWPGKKVLLPPSWIAHVNWSDHSVTVDATREQIQNAPEWIHERPVEESFEDHLAAYFAPKSKENFVAVYDTHDEAETAVRDLQKRGFDMTKLSIVGKDFHTEEEVVGYYTAGNRMMAWGTTGAFWGGIRSLLFGSAFFLVPGFGPILAAGPVVTWIVGALNTAVVAGGLGALGGALFSIGIPNDRILLYENHIRAGKFLVIAHDVRGKADRDMIALEASNRHGGKQRLIELPAKFL